MNASVRNPEKSRGLKGIYREICRREISVPAKYRPFFALSRRRIYYSILNLDVINLYRACIAVKSKSTTIEDDTSSLGDTTSLEDFLLKNNRDDDNSDGGSSTGYIEAFAKGYVALCTSSTTLISRYKGNIRLKN